MHWTPDADARLFLGVLNQTRGRLKLDYEELAAHMGSDCTTCAIEQRIVKLRKQATGSAQGTGAASKASTPSTTPRKRAAGQPAKTTPAKKVKTEDAALDTAASPQIKSEVTEGMA
ncbi:hypothetical protein BO71DRAFT_439443 [Aspergillus ellipticus CBS 707.79]|uniref:Uncharacterized protein n=1 Tax=Aspergillus ellipticus CBS 707.79 TaxID=1448320 RepID=A0A319DGU5_9EURO|nr:hypothetical protein BO71DRAFT_439443 [Aspergillus ellipticus CBS 707.79]